jgi:hypothetical protein
MKIITYKSEMEIINNPLNKEVYECGVSISFRLFNSVGNTTELHIFYR